LIKVKVNTLELLIKGGARQGVKHLFNVMPLSLVYFTSRACPTQEPCNK
jgi:hypothetical protein